MAMKPNPLWCGLSDARIPTRRPLTPASHTLTCVTCACLTEADLRAWRRAARRRAWRLPPVSFRTLAERLAGALDRRGPPLQSQRQTAPMLVAVVGRVRSQIPDRVPSARVSGPTMASAILAVGGTRSRVKAVSAVARRGSGVSSCGRCIDTIGVRRLGRKDGESTSSTPRSTREAVQCHRRKKESSQGSNSIG